MSRRWLDRDVTAYGLRMGAQGRTNKRSAHSNGGIMVTTATEPLAVSVDEASRRLGVGRTLLYDLIRRKQVRAVKLGMRTVIPVSYTHLTLPTT